MNPPGNFWILALIAAFAATSAMTIFSYMLSEAFRKLYKEPVLLDYLIKATTVKMSPRSRKIAAWIIHSLIGFVFVCAYLFLSLKGWYRVSWLSALWFGGIIGTIGIAGWRIMFALSPRKAPVALSEYFVQLFFGHLIFAAVTVGICLYCHLP